MDEALSHGRRLTLAGAPEGYDAGLIAAVAARAVGGALHIARDEGRLSATAEALRFFAPVAQVIEMPGWDCMPYDRVSPNLAVESRRMHALCRLREEPRGPRVILTTINATLQRLPPRQALTGRRYALRAGERIDTEALATFLAHNGYARASAVRDPGDYALRGGIIDLFPPGLAAPLRLDLFGDTIESLRAFDPLTQRSLADHGPLALEPAREISLHPAAIARFRAGFTARFGVVSDDPLYESVASGRAYVGMEHWLPLFYDGLETLFDHAEGAVVILDPGVEGARDARLEMIREHYEARRKSSYSGAVEAPYRPLPSELLYLDGAEWERACAARPSVVLTPFQVPEAAGEATVVDGGGRLGRDFVAERKHPEGGLFDVVREHIEDRQRRGRRVAIACFSIGSRERLSGLLQDHGMAQPRPIETWADLLGLPADAVGVTVLGIERGFETTEAVVIGEQDILGERLSRRGKRTRRAENLITEASNLSPGDFVVHIDHGIGRYQALVTLDVQGAPHDCLCMIYDGGDRLYVPVENIELLSRYGSADSEVALDRLGGGGWQARKARARKRIREMAAELIKVAATRKLRTVNPVATPDGLYAEFCARFAHTETEDQARAIADVTGDLAAGRPADRLICGDVGFGKTEVALRSAFLVAYSGRQVAVVAPTTLLCRQHFRTFAERFAGLPMRIGQLSRLVPTREAAETRRGVATGDIDIVIGTHALLSKSIAFKDLALLIVDEEQHFGVAHKERLKLLAADIHVLTLTATPIPRTLQLALTGVRELSLIATPPVDRLAVRTFIMPFDRVAAREALVREHYRGGQSFYVCPRIADLPDAEDFLRREVPEVKFGVAHGQLPASELEAVMQAFYERRFDVLVCTDIIESGLDIPTANTLIVHRADMFGLAQLYQLRGRIGRSKVRGYAYFTLPPRRTLTVNAERRLQVMQSLDDLGAGFSLASHDLDIRGAGNLLGSEQSGHIREVGFELYQQMLEEAVASLRAEVDGEAREERWSPHIALGMAVLIPEGYVEDLTVRLGLYRRLAEIESKAEIEAMAAELIDRFGPVPESVAHLLAVVEIKLLCRAAGVERVEAGPGGATLAFRANRYTNPAGLVAFITRHGETAKLRPDHRLVYRRSWAEPVARIEGVRHLLTQLVRIAAQPVAAAASPPSEARRASASKT
ncbi:MAG: transcription-repair coupling factor [Alphaproteobacteria bacterium]|nr:transcription-repair coupling factor [Alphaproteobacteria bacterium]